MDEDVFTQVIGDEAMPAADDEWISPRRWRRRVSETSCKPATQPSSWVCSGTIASSARSSPIRLVEECGGLIHPKLKILGSQLQELMAGAVASQRQRRLVTPGQHEMERGRQMIEEKGQRLVNGCVFDQVNIVEDEYGVVGEIVGDIDER